MSKIITCPEVFEKFNGGPSIFLAGGITGCPNWQADAIQWLSFLPVTLLNPRRSNWTYNAGSKIIEEQVIWEHSHLQKATQVLFWFPEETICPITLFELGVELYRPRNLWIGCHINYARRLDVEIQTKLVRPRQKLFTNLREMCASMVLEMSKV